MCVAAPVKGCQLYEANKAYGAITVQNGQIKLPNGKLINAPAELRQVVQDNNQLEACGDCRQKCDVYLLPLLPVVSVTGPVAMLPKHARTHAQTHAHTY